ncbi:MAG: hypothetical protein ABI602_04525 [Candidatus Saccharibacteria bacterium]
MKKNTKIWLGVIGIVGLILGVIPAKAQANLCTTTIAPSTLTHGVDALFDITITNTGDDAIHWVDITTPPNLYYSGQSISQDDWSISEHGDGTAAGNGNILPGGSYTFQISAHSGVENGSTVWQIIASSSPDGSGTFVCGGAATTTVSGHYPNDGDSGVSNLVLDNLSDSSVTISWDSTADTTSLIYYGATSDYGSTGKYITSHVSSHSLTLKGLSANTLYHFQVVGQDADINPYYSADNTFITSAKSVVPTILLPGRSNSPATPLITLGAESVKPSVNLLTILPKIAAKFPTISGVAEDNVAVARVEYSTDGGRNWLPVDTNLGLGTKRDSFTFTPQRLEDGDYMIVVRVIDTSGNLTQTLITKIVIDRLPPQFGNMVISYGSQELTADNQSTITMSARSEYQITGQAIGGASTVSIVAKNKAKLTVKSFGLHLNDDNGLWSGKIQFEKNGEYSIYALAVDGADNRVERLLGQINVESSGKVIDSKNNTIARAKVSLYYLEPVSRRWQLWDGRPYGQQNPQRVITNSYSLMAPAGEYYLQAAAPGYATVISNRFKVSSPKNLTMNFTLPSRPSFKFGARVLFSLPSWTLVHDYSSANEVSRHNKPVVFGMLPHFMLPKINGGTESYLDLYGRPTDLVLLSTWLPSGLDQLSSLAAVQKNKDVGAVPLYIGEQPESVEAYLRIAEIHIDGLADPDNSLAEKFQAGFGPRHLFIDRNGHIKKVMVGVLSEQTILRELGGL